MRRINARLALATLVVALISSAASGMTYYWDADAANPGFDALIDGNWNTTPYWSTSTNGTSGSTIVWPDTAGDDVVFSAANASADGFVFVANIWGGNLFSGVQNLGLANAEDLGGGKSAYFQECTENS